MDRDSAGSDDMIDIQIEESLGRETLMAIDSSNFKEDVLILVGFVSILIIATIIGIIGPKPVESQLKSNSNNGNMDSQDVYLYISSISSLNRFVSFHLSLSRDDDTKAIDRNISYGYKIAFISKEKEERSATRFVDNVLVHAGREVQATNEVQVFSERILNFDRIEIMIKLDKIKDFDRVNLRSEMGFASHTMFQIYFRLLFSILGILFLALLLTRLCYVQFKFWHLEQKLTVPLLFLLVLYNNPAIYYFLMHPSQISVLFDTVIDKLFTSYFQFFLLVLFDSLRYKNRKTDKCFFFPKLVYAVVIFVISVSSAAYADIISFKPTHNANQKVVHIFSLLEGICYVLYVIWCAVSIVEAGCQVDVTERYKFTIYLTAGGCSVALMAASTFLFDFLGLFADTSLGFVERYAIQNVFVMLMAYFHWPYEVLHDQDYIDGEADAQGALPTEEFFVNGDSD